MDLIGLPWQLIVGPRASAGEVELKERKTGETRSSEWRRSTQRFTASAAGTRRFSGLIEVEALRCAFAAFERMVALRYLRARRRKASSRSSPASRCSASCSASRR